MWKRIWKCKQMVKDICWEASETVFLLAARLHAALESAHGPQQDRPTWLPRGAGGPSSSSQCRRRACHGPGLCCLLPGAWRAPSASEQGGGLCAPPSFGVPAARPGSGGRASPPLPLRSGQGSVFVGDPILVFPRAPCGRCPSNAMGAECRRETWEERKKEVAHCLPHPLPKGSRIHHTTRFG